eukprot:CAMPEP_0198592904 /NCGR_PEP_ID=MMETSP1462-20131121/138707_1 /TAXON_ID=1333877 /ORGANISM="Brandtodinium nutriculum, Strain RCC3387" /LENGTH=31 /DNA_ID= /DNA_START= /DNA_END= /DNA_ORIENTATION=
MTGAVPEVALFLGVHGGVRFALEGLREGPRV